MGRRKIKQRPVLKWAAVAHLDAACDTDFVCGALLTKGGASTYWRASEGAFVDALLKVRGTVLFHGDHASGLGLRWILDHLIARNIRWNFRSAAKGQLQTVSVRGIQFRDAKKLWHTDLETFARGTAHPAPKLILACSCRLDCGGYCSVRGKLAAQRRASIETRAVDRCRSIWAGLERLATFQEAADIDGRSSIGSSAWGTVLRRKVLPGRDMSRSRHFFTRQASHPARVEVFRPRARRGREYDMSMAYTGALAALSFPIGEATRIWGADAKQALDDGQPGIYNALVHSPDDQFLPVLPARSTTGRARIGYPTGTFEGTWTGFELNYALQCGYSIDRMYSAQVYDKAKPLFRPWAQEMWDARREAEKAKSPMAGYIKNLANALPGTWGMDGYTEHVVRHPKEKDLEPCPCTGVGTTECPCRGRCCEGCEGECGRLAEWSHEHGIWIRRVFHPLDRAHAIWAAFVLSWCRVQVHRKAIEGGEGGYDLITIGTDGFRCEGMRDVLEMVDGPGGWRLSKELRKLHSPAGNTSIAEDAHTGEMVVRASGHPRALPGGGRLTDQQIASRITADRMLTEENHSHWGGRAIGLREGLQHGKTWTIERDPGHHEPDRIVDIYGRRWFSGRILDEGATVTRAPTIDELDEL